MDVVDACCYESSCSSSCQRFVGKRLAFGKLFLFPCFWPVLLVGIVYWLLLAISVQPDVLWLATLSGGLDREVID